MKDLSFTGLIAVTFGCLTILEDSLHIEAIRGAGLVVGGALQVVGELAGTGVIDYSRVGGTDGILTEEREKEEHMKSCSACFWETASSSTPGFFLCTENNGALEVGLNLYEGGV